MSDIATCPFCQFSYEEWEQFHPYCYKSDWPAYAPVETEVLGHAAIECQNCGIVVVDTHGGCLVDAWNILAGQAIR